MTHRQRFRTVLDRRIPDRVPVVSRLDLWYWAACADGALPPECRGLTIPQIESRLGMGRSARFRDFHRLVFDGVVERETRRNTCLHTELVLGTKTLRETLVLTPQQARMGMSGHRTEYYLKSAEDYETMTAVWRKARWEVNHDALEKFSEEVGDAGLPMIVVGPCPIHTIMILYAGYENFYLHLADFLDTVEELLRTMEGCFEKLWGKIAESPAELVLHGAHWNGEMTPPPIFEKYFLPYFSRFTQAMHEAGKQCAFHADADLAGLLDLVLATGMDVADCFACKPLVTLSLQEARRRWQDRVVIWGGIPSTILMPSCPESAFEAYLEGFLHEVSDGRAIIAGVSDNFMPGSDYSRIAEVARRVQEIDLSVKGDL